MRCSTPEYQDQASAVNSSSRKKPRWEVADIFRLHGEAYLNSRKVPASHLKIMQDIMYCRTAVLGGHKEKCTDCDCGFERPAYNSCLNRHCPKCQTVTKARWLEKRRAELLPVGYYHLVFTLPHELNRIALYNKRIIYKLFFSSVAATLQNFANNSKYLGGKIGFTSILHTWDQKLNYHVHLHCVIPAGALSYDRKSWIKARENFLFPVKPLSKVFRAKFVDGLRKLFKKGKLVLPDDAQFDTDEFFSRLIESLFAKDWVSYSKKPFGGSEKVLDYLGRYTHRVAIANHRITGVNDGSVSFMYRDRKDNNQQKECTLNADEFIRRFLLHSLPKRCFRIRHFGFLSNPVKKHLLPECRRLLGLPPEIPVLPKKKMLELMIELTGKDSSICPRCGRGIMRVVGVIPKADLTRFDCQKHGRSPPKIRENA